MDWNDIEGSWQVVKTGLRQKWPRLTDEEVESIKGREERLRTLLEEKYGLSHEAARNEIEAWRKSLRL